MNTSKILLRAPLLTQSGYGVHARQIARWLFDTEEKANIEVTTELLNWGDTAWITNIDAENGLIKKILNANVPYETTNQQPSFDVTIQLQLPNEWNPTLGKINVGVTAGVEATLCNPMWIDCINAMSLVVVPSDFTKQVFVTTAEKNGMSLTTPIAVVPESFPDAFLTGKHDPDSDVSKMLTATPTNFNVLFVGQITSNNVNLDRKNMYRMMSLLNQVFGTTQDVGLILKTSYIAQSARDRQVTEKLLNEAIRGLNLLGNPRTYLLHGSLTDQEMYDVYSHPKTKILVSLTHGEGFGLPLLEAAAAALPVMATNWSAHTEFLNNGPKWLPITATMSKIPDEKADGNIWIAGSEWADPSDQEFGVKIKKFYEGSAIPKRWAVEGAEKIKALYSFTAICKKYDQVIGQFFLPNNTYNRNA